MAVDLPPHVLAESPTIAQLAGRFPAAGRERTNQLPSSLVRLKTGSPQVRALFLFHPVGGQVYIYRDLASCLPDSQPVWGIQADGKSDSESLEAMADRYLKAVRVVQPHGPYQLGGSSFGGTLAYEIAQQLLAAAEQVAVLAMIDAPAPAHTPATDHDTPEILAYLLGQSPPDSETLAQLRQLSPDDQILHFANSGKGRLSLSAVEIGGFLQLWRSNMHALRNYVPRGYQGDAVFFRATEPDGMNRTDYHDGWRKLIAALEVHEIPDTHIGINLPPQVRKIAEVLTQRFEKGESR